MSWLKAFRDLLALVRRFSDWWMTRQAREAGRIEARQEAERIHNERVSAAGDARRERAGDRLPEDDGFRRD